TRRARAEPFEFLGKRHHTFLDKSDIGVDTLGKGRTDRLDVVAVATPFGGHVAAIEEKAAGLVLQQITGTEIGRQQTEPALAPEIDLPEPVPSRIEALDEEQICKAFRRNVGNAPAVEPDLCGRDKAVD